MTMMNSTAPRGGEDGNLPSRTPRVFQKEAFWYFHTREDVQIGPFDSEALAIKGAGDYVGFAVDADPEMLNKLSS